VREGQNIAARRLLPRLIHAEPLSEKVFLSELIFTGCLY
jgi:hypothetical protein